MNIVADKNIPFVEESFSRIGSVELLPGRDITPQKLKHADALLVRTVTEVNEGLLKNTPVKFAGTATIGCDHVDVSCLAARGIGFACAPGSNANSVAEYIVSALFALEKKTGLDLRGKTAGIIGCGNVGSLVREKLEILGLDVLLNDPPLFEETGDRKYLPLEAILAESDIITVHAPLTKTGNYPTRRMCGEEFFRNAARNPVFINTSRGGVVDSAALAAAIDDGRISAAALDVWENEPGIDTALLERCALGTPHTAGYSLDGKVNATRMLFEAACRHFKLKEKWRPVNMPPPSNPVITAARPGRKIIAEAALCAYNIEKDDSALRRIIEIDSASERKNCFDSLRNCYPVRREFSSFTVKIPDGGDCESIRKLHKLGFKPESEDAEAFLHSRNKKKEIRECRTSRISD